MTSLDDIAGLGRCRSGKTNYDLTDKPIFTKLMALFPDAAEWLREHKGGEFFYIPAKKSKSEAVMKWDDGERSVSEVAKLAGCARSTVFRVRAELRSRE